MIGLWGKKVGMTQVFAGNKVVPVTVIDTAHWFVTNTREIEKDGYNAIQVGCVRARYNGQDFSAEWIKQPKKYFSFIREIKVEKNPSELSFEVGKNADFCALISQGDKVDVKGTSIGRGFAGVVKRHGFNGPPGSHGDKMGKAPGAMSFMRTQGRVIKNKRLPGHMGDASKVIRNLEIITVKPENNVVLLKGSVPGKTGSLVFLRKS
jgi:large subunit ribosomal protein L3